MRKSKIRLNHPISIHAPREGGDAGSCPDVFDCQVFQSTPPARGATIRLCAGVLGVQFQSTPPARGATLCFRHLQRRHRHFNPRPPARGATVERRAVSGKCEFQSTPPARGATLLANFAGSIIAISIHAPREGGDWVDWRKIPTIPDFNPRPPRGGRLIS